MPIPKIALFDQVLNGQPQAVATGQTNQVVSNAFQIGPDDTLALVWRINATVSQGTAASVKLQHSLDNVAANFGDVDGTNAKVTLSATGNFDLVMSVWNSNFAAKMPLKGWLRFVCTTTVSDAVTINHCLVQLRAFGS